MTHRTPNVVSVALCGTGGAGAVPGADPYISLQCLAGLGSSGERGLEKGEFTHFTLRWE